MTNISSMERFTPKVQPSNSRESSVDCPKDSQGSFEKQLNEAADSAESGKVTKDKKPSDGREQDTEDTVKEPKGEEKIPAAGLVITDITQPVLPLEGNEANVLRGFAERTAAVVVPVLSDSQTATNQVQTPKAAEQQASLQQTVIQQAAVQQTESQQITAHQAEIQPAEQVKVLETLTPDAAAETTNASVKKEQTVQNMAVQGQTETKQPDLSAVRQSGNQQTGDQQSKEQQSLNNQNHQTRNQQAVGQMIPGEPVNPKEAAVGIAGQQPQTQENSPIRSDAVKLSGNPDAEVTYLSETQAEGRNADGTIEVFQDMAAIKQERLNSETTVKIKVAEPYTTLDQEAAKQLAAKISESVSKGNKELNIQLTPENLGRISIKISTDAEGVKVILSCDNQKTLGLLTDRATGIGHIVENNLNQQAVVEIKEDGYWNQQKNATDQHSGQKGRQQEENSSKGPQKDETDDFIQQLRLGMQGDRATV